MSGLNLPTPPENHFWRIGSVLGLPVVKLRKRVWFFSVLVNEIIPIGDATDKENVEWAAQEILDRITAHEERRQFISKYQGDHANRLTEDS
ncbi:hypothetical protein [Arthrobacter sp. AQ5-05]|uniref:hypothetical protein n=1 Tax=Arthrobacter sp. AQ5-05 TaxID=2184581 RepID=UPI0015ECBE30|nr:hypothetical protein [Arthrobacter sp. AQ5-05]